MPPTSYIPRRMHRFKFTDFNFASNDCQINQVLLPVAYDDRLLKVRDSMGTYRVSYITKAPSENGYLRGGGLSLLTHPNLLGWMVLQSACCRVLGQEMKPPLN